MTLICISQGRRILFTYLFANREVSWWLAMIRYFDFEICKEFLQSTSQALKCSLWVVVYAARYRLRAYFRLRLQHFPHIIPNRRSDVRSGRKLHFCRWVTEEADTYTCILFIFYFKKYNNWPNRIRAAIIDKLMVTIRTLVGEVPHDPPNQCCMGSLGWQHRFQCNFTSVSYVNIELGEGRADFVWGWYGGGGSGSRFTERKK